MLNVGLLPHHKRWGDFLANLGWVVVDEAHTYRGVFGSHVGNVLRRLRRAARFMGPTLFRAGVGDDRQPTRAGRAADGLEFALLDDDGAPQSGREIAMWNPPVIDKKTMARALRGQRGGRPVGRAGHQGRGGRSAS